MLKNQKNKFTMYESVIAYLGENISIFSPNEEFTDHYNAFKKVVDDIGLREDERSKATTGKTMKKVIARNSVTNQAMAIAGGIYAYAKKSGNVTLQESSNITKSKLAKFRDTGLVIELNSIKDKATGLSDILVKYGISSASLSDFADNIENYSIAIGEKATGGASRTSASGSLVTLFKEADSLLDSFDRMMENYKLSNADFFRGYKSGRVIRDLGARHNVNLKAKVAAQSNNGVN